MPDTNPLIHNPVHTSSSVPFFRRSRAVSASSLDPYEDPVTGLERVASTSNISNLSRRRREDEERLRRRNRRRPELEREHALSSKYESLNYEVSENQLYKEEEADPEHHMRLWRRSRNRWIVCFLIGVFTAVVAAAIDIMVHYSQEIKFGIIIKQCSCVPPLTTMPYVARLTENDRTCVSWRIVGVPVIFWAPIAGGSGIPQIKCFLNGIQIPEVVMLKTLISKAVGVACAVGGGLSAGKEGPMIHSGAVVGAGLSQGRCQSIPFDTGLFKEFRNDRERRDFVSAGAAAGVAAAFGAPIGGVLFSLEEGASFWNQNLTWRMFFSAMISAFTVNSILSWFNGRSGWLSWTGLANFGVFEVDTNHALHIQNKNYNIWEIPFFLAVGVIGGLTGALFNHLNSKLTEFRKKCGAKKGEYSAVAKLFFQNPEESVKSLFHSPINSFRPWTLLIFSIEYYLLTLWTFGLSVPAGVFIPAILTGAAWGRLFGIGVGRTGIDPGKYALAGAAAQLGGLVRMTISLTAIIMEATKDITFGLPIMLVLMITKWVGDIFNEGLYDMHIDIQEVPILGWHPPKVSRNILAEKVMRSDVVAMERRERVARVVAILRATNHHGFPVVDRIEESTHSLLPDYGHLKGMILRSQLITLLEKRVFYSEMEGFEGIGRMGTVKLSDFFDEDVQQDKSVDSLGLTISDEQCWMDLEPFIHPHPHRVPLNASLPFIFQLFRGLGLRYLAVVNPGMLIQLLGALVGACLAEWTVDLEYSLNNVYPLGKIELRRSYDGNFTGIFKAAAGSRLAERMSSDPLSDYQVLARSSTHQKDQLLSTSKSCLLLQSKLFHVFWLSIDAERQLVHSVTVFPDSLAAGDSPLDSTAVCSQQSVAASTQPNAVVHVTTKAVLPTPDTQLFVQMMEKERRARQHGAEADDRSFLAKYWMYIVPVVIFVVISNAMTPEGGGEG
ncbi:chloride transporter, ClC family [Ancylostoma duodenale]|uniref:Chloride channel protein n=2 Tax=Ancylostoma duodenale TaxID=51022 RepID=A0A0C2H7G9_9BILA|nr:chloride transporter, ClC family [Ancylostoma duodenale]